MTNPTAASSGDPGESRDGGELARPPLVAALVRLGLPALRVAALLFPICFMIIAATTYGIFGNPTTIGADSSNYYAAGLRLNAGHALYSVVAGDRGIVLVPPYWTIPLLAPPPIAVLWRPIALLGDGSMWLWWSGTIAAMTATVGFIAWRGSARALVAICILSPALGLTAVSGNANAFLVGLLLATWFLRDSHPRFAGACVAIAAAVKLSPALLAVWFLIRPGRSARQGFVGFVAAGVAIAGFSLLGAGLTAHLDYLADIRMPGNAAPTPLSLPGLLTSAGVPDGLASLAIPALIAIGVTLAVAWRQHERRSFAVLAVVSALATPVVYFQTIALVAAGLAPWVRDVGVRFPWIVGRRQPAAAVRAIVGSGSPAES